MKAIKLLLTLALILPSVSAAITFSLVPSSQNVNPGSNVNIDLNLNNGQAIWGFSVKVDESPASLIAYSSSSASSRLSGSFSGVNPNTADRITAYAVFPGNTAGITAGNGQLFRLTYNIPVGTPPGSYQLVPSQLTISDQNGNPIQGATISGATITVQAPAPLPTPTPAPTPPPTGETGFYLPEVYGFIAETVEIPICVTNTVPGRAVRNIDVIVTHDENIVHVTGVEVNQGNGNANILPGNTHVTISGLNVQNANCEQGSGANVATINYYAKKVGTSPLHFQSASANDGAQPFSIQIVQNNDGVIAVGNGPTPTPTPTVTNSCTVSPATIVPGGPVTVTYKITSPVSNIGGIDEQVTHDAGATGFSPSLPPTPILGSSLVHSVPVVPLLPPRVRVVQTRTPQPLLSASGSAQDLYEIVYNSALTTTPGLHTFGFFPTVPSRPGKEVSDPFSNDLPPTNVPCQVRVGCTTNSDCNDGNQCTTDTCSNNQCQNTIIPGCPTPTPTPGPTPPPPPPGGGGGGGGGIKEYAFSACKQCPEGIYNNDKYECCGFDLFQIGRFCERPAAYDKYCRLIQSPQAPPPTEGMPAQIIPEQPAEVSAPVYEAPAEEAVPGTFAGQAAALRRAAGAQGNVWPWLIGALILILLGGAFGAYTLMRRKPEEPEAPPEMIMPELPMPEERPVPRPAPRPVAPKPAPPAWVPPKPPHDNYEAIIRKKLEKIMKKKKR